MNESYENAAEISLYRDGQGYRKLPPRQQVELKQETLKETPKKDFFSDLDKDSENTAFTFNNE